MIDTITTNNLYLKFEENNEKDMAAQVFWAVFYSSQWPSQIGPTAENDSAAIPPPIFFMRGLHFFISKKSQRKSVLLQKISMKL